MRKKLISIISIIVILIGLIPISSKAVVPIDTAYIYANKKTEGLLMWKGLKIHTHLAVYKKDGKEYPAYCMNRELPGVEIGRSQTVDVKQLLNNVMVWRTIINGYPYKSPEQLGAANEEEAYTATKQAIYCYIYNTGTEKYTGIGDAGARTINAMNVILDNARNSTQNFDTSQVKVIQEEKWKEEAIKKTISKQYEILSDININKYSVRLENQPEGCKITDLQDQERIEFNSGEKFKISIPIESLKESGNFKIYIKTQMETKPIFFGKAPNADLQDYALTAYSYEDIDTELIQEYNKNETEITINKEDKDTGEKLEGAIFEILDENQKVLATLTTDEEGKAVLEQILPGKYFIKEVKSPNGYEINDEIQEIDIQLNEKINLSISNNKIIIKTEITEEPVIEEQPKLPVTGM